MSEMFEVRCSCHGHMLQGEWYPEDEQYGMLELVVWEPSRPERLRSRLRLVWKLLVTGRVVTDEVILDRDQARVLAAGLHRFLGHT